MFLDDNNKQQLAEHFFRHQYAKMLAILVRYFGLSSVEIAEDIVQDTLVEAMEKWSRSTIPNNPEGWLMEVAKKKMINYLRRHQHLQAKVLPKLNLRENLDPYLAFDQQTGQDSTLHMIFACCHPALSNEAQIALALKSLCGLSIPEIASALLSNQATINKRLYRAKQKFRNGSIQLEIPNSENLSGRLYTISKRFTSYSMKAIIQHIQIKPSAWIVALKPYAYLEKF